MTSIRTLGRQLKRDGIEMVTLESTSDYWRIWFFVLEAAGLAVQLVNAAQARNLPGRPKTDKLDAMWLARLTEMGLLRASFVPPAAIRALRDYTRARTRLVQERTRCFQQLEKLLEGALVKLPAVASKLTTASAKDMIRAMIAGERDPRTLAALARTRMKAKHDDLVEALAGMFDHHHGELAQILAEIPGISLWLAIVIIAESGSPGASPRQGPLRTVRARRPGTRLKQAPRASRARVLASCVCGPGARGRRRRVSGGFGSRPACHARPGGRGSRRRSPCGPR